MIKGEIINLEHAPVSPNRVLHITVQVGKDIFKGLIIKQKIKKGGKIF